MSLPKLSELKDMLQETLRIDDRIVSRIPLRVGIENAILMIDQMEAARWRGFERQKQALEAFKERHPLKDY